jgi:abortive infection bacteriophage resistance protein
MYFESWLENLSYVRNICAHYGRIYNIKITKTPRLYKHHAKEGLKNSTFFATLLVMKNIIPNDIHWLNFVQTLESLIKKYPCVRLNYIGFPQNWTDILKREETANKK